MNAKGTTRLGNLFRIRKEPGKPDLPVLSVTLNDGLVRRETLERKTNGKLLPEDHLLVRKGDIVYNMMRMWQGASGLAKEDGIVSPAYVVVTPEEKLDPLFASYWFKSERMIHLFWAYSYGITGDRLRLYFKDFAKVPVTLPRTREQKHIGRVLARTDDAILGLIQLRKVTQGLKSQLAQELLTAKPSYGSSDERWKEVTLKQIVSVRLSGVDKKSLPEERRVRLCNYTDAYYNDSISGDLPFMEATASDSEIGELSLREGDVIITKDSESPADIAKPAVVVEDLPDVICGYHLAILRPKKVSGTFLAQLLRLPRTRHEFYRVANGVTRFGLGKKQLRKLRLRIPGYREQGRIVAVLSAVDSEIRLLKKKTEALIKLKRALLQNLLHVTERAFKSDDG